jgi:hypothetical protein
MSARGTTRRAAGLLTRSLVGSLCLLTSLAVGVGSAGALPSDAERPFGRVGALALDGTEQTPLSAVIDPAGRFAYVGTASELTGRARVVKIDLATFTRVGALVLDPGEWTPCSAVIDPSGRFAYFGVTADPARIVRVDLATFTRAGSITLHASEGPPNSAVMDPGGRYAYFGTGASPGRVVKIDLATFTLAGTLRLETGEDDLRAAAIDPLGRYAYFGTRTEPGRVVVVDLPTFQRVNAVPLQPGEDHLTTAVIEPTGRFVHFTTATVPARMVRIRATTSGRKPVFTRDGAITLDPGEDRVHVAVIDPTGRFAYLGTATRPARVVRIDLSTFSRTGALTLQTSESYPGSAVLDPDGRFAYFGVDGGGTRAGALVKVAVGPEPLLVTRLLTTYATTTGWDTHLAADVTGNGRADLLSYHPGKGRWWVTSSNPDGTFQAPRLLTTYATTTGWDTHLAADVTGNGRADLLSYHPTKGRWWVTSSNPDGTFQAPRLLTTYATTTGWDTHLAADVTGDGRADLLSYHPGKGRWWVTSSNPDGLFDQPRLLTTYATTTGWGAHLAADITDDRRADLLSYHPGKGRWWVTVPAAGGTFEPPRLLTTYTVTTGWGAHQGADVNRDGRADLLSFQTPTATWWVTASRPDGTYRSPALLTSYPTVAGWQAHLAADVTGNGRADVLSYHAPTGRWWVTTSVPAP